MKTNASKTICLSTKAEKVKFLVGGSSLEATTRVTRLLRMAWYQKRGEGESSRNSTRKELHHLRAYQKVKEMSPSNLARILRLR